MRHGWSLGGNPGLLFSNWNTSYHLRRECLHILKDFGCGKNALEDIIEEEVGNFIQYIDDNWTEVSVDVSQFFHLTVFSSLWKIIREQFYFLNEKICSDSHFTVGQSEPKMCKNTIGKFRPGYLNGEILSFCDQF